MPLLALAYFLVLSAVLWIGIKSPHLRWSSTLIAVFLLGWATLILTAQVLSLFSALGATSAYIAISIVIAIAFGLGFRKFPLTADINVSEWPCPVTPRMARWLGWFLAGTAVLVLLGNLIMAYGLLPANPDSIVYRFPRAYWYLGHGSLKHFSAGGDPRPLYYPFNGALAYLPLVYFQLGPRSFSLLSLSCWLVVALGTYLFARNLGGPRSMAGATAWVVCLAPNVLLQSLSTNDEIIAAAPMLAGLYFVHRWFLSRQFFDAIIGAIGIGISAGTKLQLTFYWPLLLAIALTLAFHYRVVLAEAKTWLNRRGAAVLASMVAGILIFGFSFLAYNYVSSGRLMAWDFADQVLNKPFSIRVAAQTNVLFTSQVVLTPFADLHIAFNSTWRAEHYEAFNRLFAPLFTWVDNGPTYVSAFYRFTGVNTPSAVVFNEHTVFFGFTWVVGIIAAARLLWRPPGDVRWGRFHFAALPVWFITYAASTRYIEGSAVYIGYALIVSGPALVYAFAPIGRQSLNRLRWGVLAFVCATHCFFVIDVFLTSSPRNLIVLAQAVKSRELPKSRGFAVDQSVTDEIGMARAGVYHRAIGWGQPYWPFMVYHPEVRNYFFANPKDIPNPRGEDNLAGPGSDMLRYSRYVLMPPAGERHLYVYSFPKQPAWGRVAIRIPDKASAGLTWIGDVNFALGPEWAFGAGNDVETRHPGRDKYIVLTFAEESNFGHDPKPVLSINSAIYGLGPDDDLSFRYQLRIGGEFVDRTDWNSSPGASLNTVGLTGENGVLTVFVRNGNAGGTVTVTDVVLRSRIAPNVSSAR